jgi:hypothetical protein
MMGKMVGIVHFMKQQKPFVHHFLCLIAKDPRSSQVVMDKTRRKPESIVSPLLTSPKIFIVCLVFMDDLLHAMNQVIRRKILTQGVMHMAWTLLPVVCRDFANVVLINHLV